MGYTIDLAEDFSEKPFGRFTHQGDNSGEAFREDHLIPALLEHDKVTVDLSGTLYYGSPFLHEAFAGLHEAVKERPELKHLDLSSVDVIHTKLPSVVLEAKEYLNGE